MKRRYFIVAYVTDVSTGNIGAITESGRFIGKERTIELIKERNPTAKGVVVTNIMEVTADDYDDYFNN